MKDDEIFCISLQEYENKNEYPPLFYLDPLLAEKIGSCMQDISSMGRVVVGVAGVVVGLNDLQPGAQSSFRAV